MPILWFSRTLALFAIAGMVGALWLFTTHNAAQDLNVPSRAAVIWQIDNLDQPERLREPGGSGLESFPPELVFQLESQPDTPAVGETIVLPLPLDRQTTIEVRGSFRHPNGDQSVHASSGDDLMAERATLTWGEAGVFGRINTNHGLYLVHTDATGTWLLDLNDERIEVDNFEQDTLGDPVLQPAALAHSHSDHAEAVVGSALESVPANLEQIDVMFIYTRDMLDRYPGSLIETRLNHLVAIANQAMVDSEVPIVVRLVHHRPVDYSRHQDTGGGLQDLARALDGESVPGLGGVRQARNQYGADIVALTWPHNIETRGACGRAYFPRSDGQGGLDPAFGAHIDNDGISNWSVCSDAVFTHELGHNLGAQHQRGPPAGNDEPNDYSYAFVRDLRFHTVMGSFGTGHLQRYRRLNVFSSPDILCGGVACGSMTHGEGANNARKIFELAPVVAGYATSQVNGTAQRPAPSGPDSDGDGVSDWEDLYPFDPHDGQPPPVSEPPLVFADRNLREPVTADDWELLVISSANNRVLSYTLDGRFRGVVAAPEAVDPGPVLTEYSDMDIDDRGMLYLLASGDVRRFDRLSGRLIDVFLSSQLPQPRDLQSSFPRAMGWIPGNELVVLGADIVERYDLDGKRLNSRFSSDEPKKDPGSWDTVMDLPLRAFALREGRFYLAEAESNRIMTFNTLTGWRNLDLAGPDNGHVTDPWDLAFGPDGLLYVANGRDSNVLRFDVESRSFVGEFVSAGAGGLSFARALAFGPDGDLYIASRNSNEILRFDGDSGAFVEAAVTADFGGLDGPESLRFAPVLNQIHAGHSGHYFLPQRPGEGWLLEVLDNQLAALSWFTYPPADNESSEQAWVLGVGDIDGSRIVFDDVKVTRLSDPALGYEPGNLELIDWGTMTFDFHNCSQGVMQYDSSAFSQAGELAFVRLANITGVPCGSIPLAPSNSSPGISGQWYDPNMEGQGWFFQEVGPGRVFTAWFTYDVNGEQAWIVGEGVIDGTVLDFKHLFMTRGTSFGKDFDPGSIEQVDWGSMVLTFSDCDNAELEYVSELPEWGSGTMQPTRLTRLQDLACGLNTQ